MKTQKPIFILISTFVLFTALTVLVVTENAPVQAFNEALYAPISGFITPFLTSVASLIGGLTHWYTYAPIVLLLLILPTTRRKVGLPLALTLSASAILGPIILKNIFAIERPSVNQLIEPGGFGYPSGHSMNALVFFGMCAILVLRYSKKKALRVGFTIFAVVSILLVGLSRIYLGVHTVTDVLGGYLAGAAVLSAALLIENRLKQRRGDGA
ncbi:MAG: phosphatase PAP2 family protein [Oscillospiraceae bacterium]|nr:phosphatase PAP2 family protein [Oscillospiraceae bacterium]